MKEERPGIPSAVKTQLRQEAGFGCCLCGHPFIQYHHIVPWSEDQHFRPDDMMVLCGQCHPLCTVGAISLSDQRKAKLHPRNIVDGELRGKLYVNSTQLIVNLAGGKAIETPKLLVLSGETALAASLDRDTGRVLLSAIIHNKLGQTIGQLKENEWSMRPQDIWDFEVFPLHAMIRHGPRDIAFGVDVRNDQIDLRGKWFHKGNNIEFSPSEANIGSNKFIGNRVAYCGTMIAVN